MLENNNIQTGLANINAKADINNEINTEIKGELKVSDKNDIIFGNIGDNDVLNMVEYLFFNLSKKKYND